VTLEDLRDQFVRAQVLRLGERDDPSWESSLRRFSATHARSWASYEDLGLYDQLEKRCLRTAQVYVHALDHGLESAMIFKLSME
jgi:hypothetical protein